jgi:hypothetical protein
MDDRALNAARQSPFALDQTAFVNQDVLGGSKNVIK